MRKETLLIGGIAIIILALIGVGFYAWATRPLEGTSSDIATISNQLADEVVTGSGASVQTFQIIPEESKASFSIFEVLNGADKTVIGTTNQVAGTILVDTGNPANSSASPILVSARTFATDSDRRDNAIARFILKSEDPKNEFITFKASKIEGLPTTGEENTPYPLTITGDLTIAGITRPITFTATATYASGSTLRITAKGEVNRGDYNLVVPSVPMVADVGETVTIDMDLTAKQ